ncbi:MAG TPA: M23 family metallopeptidase [Gemmatimonas sp.]|uniref:M23 family metallopeptidase n=1 Tax=Gemmatimonas sp. TaxID=1962908 RepID=UPI002EDA7E0F
MATISALLLIALSLTSAPKETQPPTCQSATIRTTPAVPRAGTLFRMAMRWESGAQPPASTVAGETLHWRAAGDSLVAIAAAPIDSALGVTLTLTCDGQPPRTLRLTTDAGTYRLEALRVAPRFSATPDSALAARQAREAERAAAVSRASHDVPRLWTQPFVVPRPSRITSGFGSGRTFNGAVTSRHMGTDYAGAVGAPVRAVNRGVVRLVDAFYLGGNVVYIDHGEGLVTAYLHLSRQRVAEGDTVARGQIIGNVGATGRVTGPHLHLITRFGMVTVDPLSVIGRSPGS